MSKLHAVIMAGGSGTRFWPASRKARPKQFLPLAGGVPLIQATVDRVAGIAGPERTWIVTNPVQAAALPEVMPDFPMERVIVEPEARDTAPCVGLAAAMVHRQDPEGTMVVMPSDHVITSPEKFQQAIEAGQGLIDEDPTRIVTFGAYLEVSCHPLFRSLKTRFSTDWA